MREAKKLNELEDKAMEKLYKTGKGVLNKQKALDLIGKELLEELIERELIFESKTKLFGERIIFTKRAFMKWTPRKRIRNKTKITIPYHSVEEKREICNKYQDLIIWIDNIGRGTMLEEHFIEYVLTFNLKANVQEAEDLIRYLAKLQILNVKTFRGKIRLEFTKYTIRYLKELEQGKSLQSKDVSTLKLTDSNIELGIKKSQFIIDKLIPLLRRKEGEISGKVLTEYLKRANSNFLCTQNRVLWYLEALEQSLLEKGCSTENLKVQIKKVKEYEFNQKKILKYSSKETKRRNSGLKRPSQGKETIVRIENTTIATLVRKNIFITNIKVTNKTSAFRTNIINTVLFVPHNKIYNNKTIDKLIEDIAILKYNIAYIFDYKGIEDKKELFIKTELKLKIKCDSEEQLESIKKRLEIKTDKNGIDLENKLRKIHKNYVELNISYETL